VRALRGHGHCHGGGHRGPVPAAPGEGTARRRWPPPSRGPIPSPAARPWPPPGARGGAAPCPRPAAPPSPPARRRLRAGPGRPEQVSTSGEKLERYQEMRDFGATPEPSGAEPAPGGEGLPRFVVQEHHATSLHWDLRLERDGVLVSWAVPRGIPPDPKQNH